MESLSVLSVGSTPVHPDILVNHPLIFLHISKPEKESPARMLIPCLVNSFKGNVCTETRKACI
jgi:hypothetical protein